MSRMDCRQVHQLVFDYSEGSLPQGECSALRSHLESCAACRDFVVEYTETSCMCRDALGCDWTHRQVTSLKTKLRKSLASLRPKPE